MTPRRLVCLGSLMVAADVDNDLFKSGETTDKSDGDAIANLTYRVTALYSGLDTTLGQPRLGRDAAVVCGNPPLPANRTPGNAGWDAAVSTPITPFQTMSGPSTAPRSSRRTHRTIRPPFRMRSGDSMPRAILISRESFTMSYCRLTEAKLKSQLTKSRRLLHRSGVCITKSHVATLFYGTSRMR
jgi:hypothetical protein